MAKQKQEKGGGCSGCGCLSFLLVLGALGYFGYTRQAPLREQAAKYGVQIPEVRLPEVKIPAVKLPWAKATPAPVAAKPTPFPSTAQSPPVGNGDDALPEPTETPTPSSSPASDESGTELTAAFEKEIPIGALKRLVLTVQRGDVTITADSPGTIRINATRKIDASADRELATRWRDAAKLIVEPKGDALVIRDTVPVSLPGTDATAAAPPRVTLDIEIHVPPGQQITVTDTLGNIRAAGPFRAVTFTTATGDILAEKVTVAEAAVLKAGVGSLSFLGTAGALKASTGSGDIHIGDEKAPATVQKRMEAVTGVGNIVSELIRAPQAQLIAQSSIGDVKVRLPRNVKAQAQLSVGKGQASSGLALAKKPDGSLSGALNGGGSSMLRLETTTGNARLEGR